MDELEISGKRYISSKRAAELHKYHADYIGQLIRGQKVPGQKVGRAWYIDADALAAYLGKEVPPRGPMKKDEPKEAPEQEVEGPQETVEEITEEPKYNPVTFNVRRSREHIIEPLAVKPQEVKREIPTIIKEVYVEEVTEPVVEVEAPHYAEASQDEENFIPLKIEEEPISKPEDSFYKISRSGLRYIAEGRPTMPRVTQMHKVAAVPLLEKKKSSVFSIKSILAGTAAVTVAGVLSLVVLGAFSYYLKSTVSVGEKGQTSSVHFSE
jgi:hypothetical protein